jgi:inositol oxygenase
MPALALDGRAFDEISDAVDTGMSIFYPLSRWLIHSGAPVNVLKGKLWDSQAEFVVDKDKTLFRQYETACDRVKAVYKEQHGMTTSLFSVEAV